MTRSAVMSRSSHSTSTVTVREASRVRLPILLGWVLAVLGADGCPLEAEPEKRLRPIVVGHRKLAVRAIAGGWQRPAEPGRRDAGDSQDEWPGRRSAGGSIAEVQLLECRGQGEPATFRGQHIISGHADYPLNSVQSIAYYGG